MATRTPGHCDQSGVAMFLASFIVAFAITRQEAPSKSLLSKTARKDVRPPQKQLVRYGCLRVLVFWVRSEMQHVF